jgi:hypothetical protein
MSRVASAGLRSVVDEAFSQIREIPPGGHEFAIVV